MLYFISLIYPALFHTRQAFSALLYLFSTRIALRSQYYSIFETINYLLKYISKLPSMEEAWSAHPWALYIVVIGLPILLLLSIYPLMKRPFMRSLKKKHVFITGGSSGIGLAIAEKALMEGAYVTLISRNVNNLTSAVESLLHHTPFATADHIRHEAADVSDHEALAGVIERAFAWRPIDVFVCNAGLTRGGYLGDGRIQDLEITVQTNFMGSVNALHAALPLLKCHSQSHPVSIVIMASLASLFFMYGHSVYTAIKYAMRGLAEGLRFELIPFNIKVSLICPGFTSTPFLDEADKEREIRGLLRWVNLYSRRWAESPQGVAAHSLRAVKSGAFLVTTSPLGLVLSTVGRGFVPSDSLPRLVFELLFILPFRIASFVVIPFFRLIVRRRKGVSTPYDITMASPIKPMDTTSVSNN